MDPITRKEKYLNAILTGDTSNLPAPITREEQYLYAIAMNGGGGGGGGTTNYNALNNLPQINDVELKGNKTASDLGLASRSELRSVYRPSGDKTVAELTASLLIADNLGKVYNMTDAGTTTANFTCGAGKAIKIDDNVAIVDVGTNDSPVYKFDLFSGMIDMSSFQTKALANALLIAGGLRTTVETALGALAGVEMTGTLVAGQANITFTDEMIIASRTFEVYTDVFGMECTGITVTAGSLTLEFPVQSSDMAVKVVMV